MDWRIKAFVQGALARAPGGLQFNERLQRYLGGRRDCGAHVDSKFQEDWLIHMSYLRDLGFSLEGRHLLEIGTGWLPIMPLCFHLAGIARVTTVDLSRHLRYSAVRVALLELERHLAAIAQAAGQSLEFVRGRWQALADQPDGAAILAKAGIHYQAPADATRTGLAPASVDIVFSNSVLEHVSSDVLAAIMHESRRILRHDGLVLHGVNCGDHYAYFDRKITPIHYLRYSDEQWRRWNNDLHYQNRLRPVDFLDAAQNAGLTIALKRHRARSELLAKLQSMPIAEQFKRYDAEQLCTTSIDFVARPAPLS